MKGINNLKSACIRLENMTIVQKSKVEIFEIIIKELCADNKKLDPYNFVSIIMAAFRQEEHNCNNISDIGFSQLKKLMHESNRLIINKYPISMMIFLALAFMCLKGKDAFIGDGVIKQFDYVIFKEWLGDNFVAKYNIQSNKINDKHLKEITMDISGNITFGHIDFCNCGINIDAPFITFIVPGEIKYVGEWKNDLPHGSGTMIFLDKRVHLGSFYQDADTYVGQFLFGERSGLGVLSYARQPVYEGHWKNNLPHGYGVWTLFNGTIYEGSFRYGDFVGHNRIYLDMDREVYPNYRNESLFDFDNMSMPIFEQSNQGGYSQYLFHDDEMYMTIPIDAKLSYETIPDHIKELANKACPIKQDGFSVSEQVYVIQEYKHYYIFNARALDEWIKQSNTNPFNRKELRLENFKLMFHK